MRGALDDAAPLYRDAPEAMEIREAWDHQARTFMAETLPDVSEKARNRAADLVTTTLAAVGKQFSERPRSMADIDAYADAVADMLCAYIRHMMAR